MHSAVEIRGQSNPQPKSYKKVNSYSHRPSFQQILTLLLFLIILILHAVFIMPAIVVANHAILWVMAGCTYLLLLIMAYDYCYLTCVDPVDDLVLGIHKQYPQTQLVNCVDCNKMVHKQSYHCHVCDRCSQYFDHHCKYLNNCIGGKNYHSFLRLLICVTAYCISIMAQGIWVFVKAANQQSYSGSIVSKWGTLVAIIFTFLVCFAVDTLLCFHYYLVFCLKTSTIKFLNNQYQQNNQTTITGQRGS